MDRNEALQTIADLRNEQTKLMARGDELDAKNQQLTTKVDDLMAAQRALSEVRTLAPEMHGGDRRLTEYVERGPEGIKGVRWTAGDTHVTLPNGVSVKTTEYGLLDDPEPCNEWHQELIKRYSFRNLARAAQKMSGGGRGRASTPNLDADLYKHMLRGPGGLTTAMEKAFYDVAGSGAEWIPDQFIPDVYQEFQTPRRLRALFPQVNVTGNTILRPRLTVGGKPYIKSNITTDDPAAYTASTPTTADTTISMSGLAVHFVVDDAAMEDSAIAAASILRRELLRALEDGYEDAMVNGDSAATHQDDIAQWNIRSRWGSANLGGDADHRRYFLGLRANSYDASTTTDLSGTMSVANFATLMADLGERGVGNLVAITSPEAMVTDFLTLTQVLTVDQYGQAATVLTGELAQILGVPLVMSRYMSNDLAATGLYTASGATTGVVLADLDAFQRYSKRGQTVEIDKDIKSGAVHMVATLREVFDSPDPAATKNTAFGFNL